jgi:hypothetical protein
MEFWARLDEDFPDYQTALLDAGREPSAIWSGLHGSSTASGSL